MSSYFSIICLECASFVLRALTYMPVLIYLGGSCLHLSLGTLILVVEMVLGGKNMGHIQNIKSMVIPGNAYLETN